MEELYRNLLQSTKYISISNLTPGATYRIISRYSFHGIWVPEEGGFAVSAEKYGMVFPFVEYHWAIHDYLGTAKPFEYIEQSPFDSDYLDSLNYTDFRIPSKINGDVYYGPMEFHNYLNSVEDPYTALYKLSKYQ